MNNEIRKQLKEEGFIRNLSPRTCSIYEYHISKFIAWNDCENIDELTIYNARDYILEKRKDGKTTGYCNGINSALTFFYKHILHQPWNHDIVPRMKLEWTLPQVLTRSEIEKLVNTAKNARNKAIIALIYSSGLRVGEVVKLAPGDIYMSTMQIHVRNSKNHGDHWSILLERTLELLKQYCRECPEERDTLFVTLRKPHKPLKTGGIEIMLKRIGAEAGIDVHPHILRHSFATHLIENETPREYVQTLLGHKSPSSTAIYVHVTNKAIMGVKSPFDLPIEEDASKDNEGKGDE